MQYKFRGKSIKTNKWVYGGITITKVQAGEPLCFITNLYFDVTDDGHPYEHPEFIEVRPDSVGMFTTQHDQYGKELYSNDFVEIEWDDGKKETYLIDWCEWGFSSESCGLLPESESMTLIGNTTDNKDLLTDNPEPVEGEK